MQFRKIDEHKIHCIISQEEMSQKGIQIEDFLDHRDKTEAFLREILAEAKYELNLDEDMGRCFSVQMAVMPEGDVSLVISGEDHGSTEETLTEFGKRLQDFKEIMEEAKRKLDAKKEKLRKRSRCARRCGDSGSRADSRGRKNNRDQLAGAGTTRGEKGEDGLKYTDLGRFF